MHEDSMCSRAVIACLLFICLYHCLETYDFFMLFSPSLSVPLAGDARNV